MSEAIANLINRSNPEAFFGIVITIGGAFLVAIIGVITASWSQWRKRELDASLKQDMLARGMSAEEIDRVLSAGTASAEFRKWWTNHQSFLKQDMLDRGMSAEEIERVLSAGTASARLSAEEILNPKSNS